MSLKRQTEFSQAAKNMEPNLHMNCGAQRENMFLQKNPDVRKVQIYTQQRRRRRVASTMGSSKQETFSSFWCWVCHGISRAKGERLVHDNAWEKRRPEQLLPEKARRAWLCFELQTCSVGSFLANLGLHGAWRQGLPLFGGKKVPDEKNGTKQGKICNFSGVCGLEWFCCQ